MSRPSKKATHSTKRISGGRPRKSVSPKSSVSGASGSKTLRLNADWSEFLRALTSTGTKFLLVGGHALAVHAEPRFTEDLDVFAEPTEANARRLREALVAFGFGELVPPASELAVAERVFMLGRKPRRIDILTGITGVSFAQAARNAVTVEVDGVPVRVIGRAALIRNKRSTGRLKDRLDVELLEASRKPRRPARG